MLNDSFRWDRPFPRTGCNLDCDSHYSKSIVNASKIWPAQWREIARPFDALGLVERMYSAGPLERSIRNTRRQR